MTKIPYDIYDIVTPLTFAITGMSKDRKEYAAAGTGFFVAPYTALTAAHVVRFLWDRLEAPWNEHKYPKRTVNPEFFAAAVQQVDIRRPDVAAHWEITGVTPLNNTDIAFLNVVPRSEVAEKMEWPSPFPELELLPPNPGELVWSFGYPDAEGKHTPGESVVNFESQPTLISGEVINYHPGGRGTWRFPQFEVTIPFEPGMSGGPVIHQGKIAGLVSYGPNLEQGKRGASFASALWPIVGSELSAEVDPRLQSNPVLEMLNTGAIRAANWKSIQSRIRITQTETGDDIVELA